jgi:hypothetical protein
MLYLISQAGKNLPGAEVILSGRYLPQGGGIFIFTGYDPGAFCDKGKKKAPDAKAGMAVHNSDTGGL